MTRVMHAGIGLFVAAAGAFAFGAYALGIWLALGAIGSAALVLTASMRADQPTTVAALQAIDARLAQIEHKATFLAATIGAAMPQQAPRGPTPAGKLTSPVRPPFGHQR